MIEGTIIEAAHTTADNRCEFMMLSTRDEADPVNGGSVHIETPLEVEVKFWRLAKACIENLPIGRGLRVVGRLEAQAIGIGDGQARLRVVIIAEHVEFKPSRQKTPGEKAESALAAAIAAEEDADMAEDYGIDHE